MMKGRFHFKYTHYSIIIEDKGKRINIIQHISFVKKRYIIISNNIINNNFEAFIISMILFEVGIPLYLTY